jgi:ComF family protein
MDENVDGRASLTHGIQRMLRSLADIVVPPLCLACHERIGSHDALCATCWRQVAFIKPPLCDRLGLPLPYGDVSAPIVSAAAVAAPPPWQRARAVALYEPNGPIARLVSGMKYADRHDARRLFGKWLAGAGRELLSQADIIVPVPLARWRLVQRQFNQSALLAAEVSKMTGVPWNPSLLAKTRSTRPQVQLAGAARRDNLKGAFLVPARLRPGLAGRRVVLLDDVITTGTTMEACTRTLLAAGASGVDVLALAIASPPTTASP